MFSGNLTPLSASPKEAKNLSFSLEVINAESVNLCNLPISPWTGSIGHLSSEPQTPDIVLTPSPVKTPQPVKVPQPVRTHNEQKSHCCAYASKPIIPNGRILLSFSEYLRIEETYKNTPAPIIVERKRGRPRKNEIEVLTGSLTPGESISSDAQANQLLINLSSSSYKGYTSSPASPRNPLRQFGHSAIRTSKRLKKEKEAGAGHKFSW